MKKLFILPLMMLILLGSVYAVQCDYNPSLYAFLDTAETGAIGDKWNNEASSVYSNDWAKFGSFSIKTISEAFTMSTPVFAHSNTLISWVNVSYSPMVDIRRWIYVKDGATVHCSMGIRGSNQLQIGAGNFFNRNSVWDIEPYKPFQIMIQIDDTPNCNYYARNSTEDDWTNLGFDNVASAKFDTIQITNEGGATASEVVFWDNVGVLNATSPTSCIELVVPIVNSSWAVTSGNVLDTPTTAWNTGDAVNVTSDLLSFTVTTNVNSNMSCRLGVEGNYSENIAFDSQTKATTTETTSHSLTLFESLSVGSNSLYCGFIDDLGRAETNGGVSHSGELIVNRIVLPPDLEVDLVRPFNNTVLTSNPVSWEFSTNVFANCSLFFNGVLNESFVGVNGTQQGLWLVGSDGDYNSSVVCDGNVSGGVHLFTFSEVVGGESLVTNNCPGTTQGMVALVGLLLFGMFLIIVGFLFQIPFLVFFGGVSFLTTGWIYAGCSGLEYIDYVTDVFIYCVCVNNNMEIEQIKHTPLKYPKDYVGKDGERTIIKDKYKIKFTAKELYIHNVEIKQNFIKIIKKDIKKIQNLDEIKAYINNIEDYLSLATTDVYVTSKEELEVDFKKIPY